MTYRAVLKDMDGKPAAFIGSRTGREDAEVVLLRVGDREETARHVAENTKRLTAA